MEVTRKSPSPPYGLKWRSGCWYVTWVVWLGIAVDLISYSIIVPVMPFHLEELGYDNVSSLTGYLLFAYSAGLAITTFPVGMFSERYNSRQWPLILGIFLLIGSMIMLMEARAFWLMVLGRVLQGISSTMIWVVGLALLCDTTPERVVGRQLGLAMSGLSIGYVLQRRIVSVESFSFLLRFLLGPSVGGALYVRFGFRGPCLCVVIATFIDLVARLIVIERKVALCWGHDPQTENHATGEVEQVEDVEANPEPSTGAPVVPVAATLDALGVSQAIQEEQRNKERPAEAGRTSNMQISLLQVMAKLLTSTRAVSTVLCILIYGTVHTAIEPSLPKHMNVNWGFDSTKVGLVFIAAVVPTFFASGIAGYLCDKIGAAPVTFTGYLLAVPWWMLCTRRNLGLFITSVALEFFFTSTALAPLTAELAEISRQIEGIGYGHIYAAFNLAYGVGATIGPLMGGQIYDNVRNGWNVLCYVGSGWCGAAAIIIFFFVGERTIFKIFVEYVRG